MAVERPPGGRLAIASMALAALCFAWGAIALWPFHGAPVGDDLLIVVLDSSASVSRIRSGLAGSSAVLLREQARGAQAAGQKFAVITASPQGQRRWGPADPMDFLEGESEGSLRPLRWAPLLGEDLSTDWTGTLALVENLASGDGVAQSQVVLFTDGRASDARAWDSLARLAAKGCVLQYGELPPITGVEVALAGLDVPVECSPGVPGTVRVEMAWRGAAVPPDLTWPWRMEIRDAGGLVHGSEGVWPVDATLQSQGWKGRTQTLPLPALAQGVYGVRVDLNGIAGDRSSENQFQQALLRVGDPLQVLVAGSGGPGLTSESVGAGLNATGLVSQSVEVGELERWLPEAHLLLTLDLAPADLPAEVLASFVHRGGVWLALGEKSMLPGWSGRSVMNGKDLGALLPLTPDHGDGPAKDVILLVDGSGSMQGDPWTQVQSATLTLLRNIPREVGFEVDLFTHDLLEAELRLAPVQVGEGEVEQRRTEASLRSFLEARVPGGKTNIMSSLKSLLERRGDRGACKLVLITDGWQNDGGSWDPAWLRAQMGGVGMELSIVATSENPNLADLGLLMDREHILLAEDLVGLAELLKEELMGDVIRRDPDMRVSGGEAGKGLAWGLEDRLLESSAPVASFVKTKPRPGAEVLLQADRAEPIFSVVTRGRGAAAQVTSLQGAEFLWDGSVGLRGLVSELAHWARAQQGGGPDIVALDGDFFLEGAGEGAELLAREGLSNDWTRVPLEMGLGGSGLDPRDWLRLNLEPFEGQDLESLELRLSVPGSVPEALVLPISAPAELLPGGHVWPRELPQAVPAGAPVGSGPHPSGPVALVLGLLAVVAGLGFRVLGGKGFAESADRN